MEIKRVSLKNYSSLHIGGEANIVVVRSEEELVETVMHAKSGGLRVHVLGEGTNTYFGETLENILIIKNEIKGIEIKPQATSYWLAVGSGENWDDTVKYAVENNLWGIENLSYVPGTVGAAPVQNIGAYGMELKDSIISVRVYDFENEKFLELINKECNFGYRSSIFKQHPQKYIITSVTIQLSKSRNPILTYKPLDALLQNTVTLGDIRSLVINIRKEKLPNYTVYPNAGSFFKNTIISKIQGKTLHEKYSHIVLFEQEGGYKVPTAWLIDHVANMKGVRVRDVGTWPVQPLVLVNYGNATSEELNSFANSIIEKIKKETGITLEREVNFVE